LALGDFSRERI
jgi:ribosomal 50S subunit-recycling heat shock protein